MAPTLPNTRLKRTAAGSSDPAAVLDTNRGIVDAPQLGGHPWGAGISMSNHAEEHLEYAQRQLREALSCLSEESDSRSECLQKAWTRNVQHLWERRYLPEELNERFKEMWHRYTARTDDSRTTKLRDLTPDEVTSAIEELECLASDAIRWKELS